MDADDEEVAQFASLPQQIDVVLVYKSYISTHDIYLIMEICYVYVCVCVCVCVHG